MQQTWGENVYHTSTHYGIAKFLASMKINVQAKKTTKHHRIKDWAVELAAS